MKKLICKILGHHIVGLNTKRHFAWCDRCDIGLKVSYDMGYGETLVVGEYKDQKTFCWCSCGNELCSSGSHVFNEKVETETGIVEYNCSRCHIISFWDFNLPVPALLKEKEPWD